MKKVITGLCLLGFIGCTQSDIMELKGRLSVKGSSVHTYLNIEDSKSNKSYKIQNKNSFDLMQKQNQRVKIKAKLIKKETGPGFPAVVEVIEVK